MCDVTKCYLMLHHITRKYVIMVSGNSVDKMVSDCGKGIVADSSSSLFKLEKSMDYYGSKWKKKRKHILRLDGYVCQVSRMYGRTEEATVVHHIYPADMYPEWAWEDWNLISVSMATHNRLENRQTGELTEEGLRLQQMIRPGEDWRKRRAGK